MKKKKVKFYAFSPSVHKEKWLGQSLCIEPLVESCAGSERGKERAREAVQMITSPHGFVERRPVNSFHHGQVRWGPRERWSSGGYFLCGWMCASHATKREAALDIVEEVMDGDLLTQIMGVFFSFQCPDTHIFIKSARK